MRFQFKGVFCCSRKTKPLHKRFSDCVCVNYYTRLHIVCVQCVCNVFCMLMNSDGGLRDVDMYRGTLVFTFTGFVGFFYAFIL